MMYMLDMIDPKSLLLFIIVVLVWIIIRNQSIIIFSYYEYIFCLKVLNDQQSGNLEEYVQFLGDLQDLANRGLRLNTFESTPSIFSKSYKFPFTYRFEEDGENRLGFLPASDHPRYKAKIVVNINDLNLSVMEKAVFMNLLGPRYNFRTKEATIVSRHFGDKVTYAFPF